MILITGAGKGIGRILARELAARGAIIAANDISPLNVDSVVDELILAGGQARAYIHDVAKKVAVQTMVNQVMDDFGRLDVLVNCANVQPAATLLDLDEWDLHRAFEVNAIGTFLMMQSVGRVMRQAGIPALIQRADEGLKPCGIRVFALHEEASLTALLRLLETA